MADVSNFIYNIEILQKRNSLLTYEELVASVSLYLTDTYVRQHKLVDPTKSFDVLTKFENTVLTENVEKISIYRECSAVVENGKEVHYHVYSYNSTSPEIKEEEEDQQISTHWLLPTEDFAGLWDSLVYDVDVKEHLLGYVSTALQFSEKSIDPNIITCNRLVLLHGPPGTGKTSLCKALAQKVAIRLSSTFQYGLLVEVNTHSLFSKWFSESGKLVSKMFHGILQQLEDPKVLVIVLLDEVETLARARSSTLGGNEPSDALRVVNAVLTHLDMIKRYPNVLILTTSNLTDAIDVALIDRADIKQFIGLPSAEAIYQIYSSCICELAKAGFVDTNISWFVDFSRLSMEGDYTLGSSHAMSLLLKKISQQSLGFSGRTLRKMPFIAFALFVKSRVIKLDEFLEALSKAVEKQWNDVRHLKIHV